MDILSLAGAILPGLFGASRADKAAALTRTQFKEDQASKFTDLRDAAIRGGFSPLTALQATGGSGFGAAPSSAPPLASTELLTGALQGGIDEVTGVAGQRRAADQLNYDLSALRFEQARSGVAAYAAPSAAALGSGGSPLGRSAVTAAAVHPSMERVNMFIEVYNPATGKTFQIPNPDLTESGPSEMATGMAVLTAAEMGSGAVGGPSGIKSAADAANAWLKSMRGPVPGIPVPVHPSAFAGPFWSPNPVFRDDFRRAQQVLIDNPDF